MSIENPLGLYDLIVNTIAGSEILFALMAIVFIAFLAAKFSMPGGIFFVSLAFFGILFSVYIGELYLIIIILAAFAIGGWIAKKFM